MTMTFRSGAIVVTMLFLSSALFAQSSGCEPADFPCQIVFYSRVVRTDPKNIEAYYHLGFAYQRTRQPERAMEMYKIYLSSSSRDRPNLANAYNNRGILYRQTREFRRALDDFDRAINLDPYNPRFLSNRGNVYRDLERFDEAIADYRNALVSNENFGPALHGLGIALGVKGETDLAISTLSRAIEHNAGPDAVYNRGVMFSRKEDYASALNDYTRYIGFDSPFRTSLPGAYLNRGIANYYLGDVEAALADLSQAIEADRELLNAYRVRSMIYREQQKLALAEADESVAARLSRRN
ncbi:MAG TPA: tetratricopeptide repeat protein [Pyrinomonadaceae bacterium]|nr:tetratricopeptide repeat protein [Pyrinomonadaceae bacterium]HMP66253.1 tetratricopeptide repeat protein [Pyrinomonadaceae bacterium]